MSLLSVKNFTDANDEVKVIAKSIIQVTQEAAISIRRMEELSGTLMNTRPKFEAQLRNMFPCPNVSGSTQSNSQNVDGHTLPRAVKCLMSSYSGINAGPGYFDFIDSHLSRKAVTIYGNMYKNFIIDICVTYFPQIIATMFPPTPCPQLHLEISGAVHDALQIITQVVLMMIRFETNPMQVPGAIQQVLSTIQYSSQYGRKLSAKVMQLAGGFTPGHGVGGRNQTDLNHAVGLMTKMVFENSHMELLSTLTSDPIPAIQSNLLNFELQVGQELSQATNSPGRITSYIRHLQNNPVVANQTNNMNQAFVQTPYQTVGGFNQLGMQPDMFGNPMVGQFGLQNPLVNGMGMQQPLANPLINGMGMQQPLANPLINGMGMQQPFVNQGMNQFGMQNPLLGGYSLQSPFGGQQFGLQNPLMNGMGMQNPLMNGMGMQQQLMNPFGMQNPLMNGAGMQTPFGMQAPMVPGMTMQNPFGNPLAMQQQLGNPFMQGVGVYQNNMMSPFSRARMP